MYLLVFVNYRGKKKIIYFDFFYLRDGLIIIGDIEMVF